MTRSISQSIAAAQPPGLSTPVGSRPLPGLSDASRGDSRMPTTRAE